MPQTGKSARTNKQQGRADANAQGSERLGAAGPQAPVRAWATGSKLNGGGAKIALKRKVPSGPVGGSGRKTNLARSS